MRSTINLVLQFFTAGIFVGCIGGALVFLGSALPSSFASAITLDAPTRTITILAVQKAPIHTTAKVVNPSGEVVMLDDWTYTGAGGSVSVSK